MKPNILTILVFLFSLPFLRAQNVEIIGGAIIDSSTFVVDAVNNNVAIGKATTSNKFEVFVDSFSMSFELDQTSLATGDALLISPGSIGAQTFVADTTGELTRIEIMAKKSLGNFSKLNLEIRSGKDPAIGTFLGSKSFFVTSVADSIYSVVFTTPIAVSKNDDLVMILVHEEFEKALWQRSTTDVYPSGIAFVNTGNWQSLSQDHWFKSYIEVSDTNIVSQFTVATNGNVGIGTTSPSQKLHVRGNTKIQGNISESNHSPALEVEGNGVLFPRFTSQERDALPSPTDGLIIYNTETKCIELYRGTLWYSLCDGGQIVTREINLLLGGLDDERAESIQLTSDGGFIMAAYTNSSASGDITSMNHGFNDIWIVKLNGYGAIIWEKLIGGSQSESSPTIRETNDGGFIVLCTSSSSANGDVTDSSHGLSDLWIVKLDVLGNIIWNKLLGGDNQELGYDIELTSDGGYIILASSSSSANGDVTDVNSGSSDYWIVKLDDLGNIVWNKLYGGNVNETPGGIQQTFDGGYIILGTSRSSSNGDVSDVNHGENDYWLLKIDSQGNIDWDRLLGGDRGELGRDVVQSDDGGYVLFGTSTTSENGDVMGVNNGANDPDTNDWWVVRVDSQGNIQWGKLLGGSSYDGADQIRQTMDGGFILLGNSKSSQSGDVAGINKGLNDGWIAKIDGLGTLIWEKLLGGDEQDYFDTVCQTSEGILILAGHTDSSANGDIPGSSHGGDDLWIIKLDQSGNIIND